MELAFRLDDGAGGGPAEKRAIDQAIDRLLTESRVHLPEPRRLGPREMQAGHRAELALDALHQFLRVHGTSRPRVGSRGLPGRKARGAPAKPRSRSGKR